MRLDSLEKDKIKIDVFSLFRLLLITFYKVDNLFGTPMVEFDMNSLSIFVFNFNNISRLNLQFQAYFCRASES